MEDSLMGAIMLRTQCIALLLQAATSPASHHRRSCKAVSQA